MHWNPNTPHHDSRHTPALGLYDSRDTAVVTQHALWSLAAGIDGWIVSWWGEGTFEDGSLGVVLAVAEREGLLVSAMLEDAPSTDRLRRDAAYLAGRAQASPAWLRVQGRPVVFVYGRVLGQRSPREIHSALAPTPFFALADATADDVTAPFQGIHFYNPLGVSDPDAARYIAAVPGFRETFHQRGKLFVAAVVPGYDDTLIRRPGLRVERADGALYRRLWAAAAGADWVTVTSWNEWHEGSEIEPSAEFGERYLQLTRELSDAWRATRRP